MTDSTDPAPDPSVPADPPPPPPVPVICERCRAEGMAGDAAFAAIPDILNFDPVPRRSHSEGWRPAHQRSFIAALAITGSPRRAARAVGRHAFGAEQLRTARGGKSFSLSWDAALEIYRDRELSRIKDNLAELAKEEESRERPAAFAPERPERESESFEEQEHLEARDRIRERLLRVRRMYLARIADDPASRSAWEVLAGPVDWDKAARMEPQDGEGFPNMRSPDMILPVREGYFPEATGGPSIAERVLESLKAMRAEMEAEQARTGR